MTASGGVITLRLRFAGAADPAHARGLMDSAEAGARAALGESVVSRDDDRAGPEALAHAMIAELQREARTLSVVESCTGGLLGSMLTSVPGASSVFAGGALTYSNALKAELGVPGHVLERSGAVSRQCAIELALCGLARFGTDWCVSITGIAGPGGGSPDKPVGTVFIGLAGRRWAAGSNAAIARHLRVTGDRTDVQVRSAASALTALHFAMRGQTEAKLLWEVARA
jgi:PncC family amidohydrolase